MHDKLDNHRPLDPVRLITLHSGVKFLRQVVLRCYTEQHRGLSGQNAYAELTSESKLKCTSFLCRKVSTLEPVREPRPSHGQGALIFFLDAWSQDSLSSTPKVLRQDLKMDQTITSLSIVRKSSLWSPQRPSTRAS